MRMDAGGVTFRVKNYRVDGPRRYTTMTLNPAKFIRRFLIYVLPKGQHRIRHYGFIGNGRRAANIAKIRELLQATAPSTKKNQGNIADSTDDQAQILALPCPHCAGRLIIIVSFPRGCQPRAPPAETRNAA